jgi:Tfp pilus assembly protein PilF
VFYESQIIGEPPTKVSPALKQRQIDEQFDLAQQDFHGGNIKSAQTRLEFVLRSDPDYPGAAELLGQIQARLTPTPHP